PPRTTLKFYPQEDMEPLFATNFAHQNRYPSTSVESADFAEIPLLHNFKNRIGSFKTKEMHKSVFVESNENVAVNKPGVMSHSLDEVTGQSKFPSDLKSSDNITECSTNYDNTSQCHKDTELRHGFLERCKLSENGVKLKRKDWSSAYAYLYIGHLLFYKDQKSAEKHGKHYPAPLDVCDLRDAIVQFITDDKKQRDKRKKHIISLLLPSKTEYHFCSNEEEINDWFYALRQAIISAPALKISSNKIICDWNGSLQRSIRHKRDSASSTFGIGKSTLHNSIKSPISDDHFSSVDNNAVEVVPPAKATIIERLLRFFRSRPSMESLRERGIYKPEPVFGSTLSEICFREKSLVPKFITEVTTLIEQKGLDCDGLYRVNGNLSSVQKIRCQIDQDNYEPMRREEDIHVLSGALKMQIHNLAIIFGPSMFCSDERNFKTTQDKGKSNNIGKRKTVDKRQEEVQNQPLIVEPTQNLAFRMITYGQILEFILTEAESMDDFLVFGKTIADPWNRVCSLDKPIILFVEFCQIIGPRPLFSYPEDACLNHLLEELSLWLMSSDNFHGNFTSAYNQQLGVYILTQYATMLDITARALQRPFALSLVLPQQKPTPEQILIFRQISMEILLPLLSCNRYYIHSMLTFASKLADNCEKTNFQSYYSTSGNVQQIVVLSSKIKEIMLQSKSWYDRFLVKMTGFEEITNTNCTCECKEEDFRKFIRILCWKQMAQLVDLMELAPCAGKNYFNILKNAYNQFIKQQKSTVEGLMFSGNMPVLRLLRCVYPLLTGEKIVILASQQRTPTGMDLLEKLNKLQQVITEHQLSGISCDKELSLNLSDKNAKHEMIIIDLNNHRIKCREYRGFLLRQLAGNSF
uniref:Uncharacterized protein n=1 Tax=Meloidogyne javanica TaxID=6303 RepID=A0A915MZA8_MELJA